MLDTASRIRPCGIAEERTIRSVWRDEERLLEGKRRF